MYIYNHNTVYLHNDAHLILTTVAQNLHIFNTRYIPYSWKLYWRELNLVDWPQPALT